MDVFPERRSLADRRNVSRSSVARAMDSSMLLSTRWYAGFAVIGSAGATRVSSVLRRSFSPPSCASKRSAIRSSSFAEASGLLFARPKTRSILLPTAL